MKAMTINNVRSALAVEAGDEIWLTLMSNGRVVANVCGSHFSSIGDVLNCAFGLPRPEGLSQLTIRNRTQGWSSVRNIARCRRSA